MRPHRTIAGQSCNRNEWVLRRSISVCEIFTPRTSCSQRGTVKPKLSQQSGEETATRSEFAKRCRVTKGRVSQWISEGKISQREMVGSGRSARIRVDAAKKRLKVTLDDVQRTGNGLDTNLDGDGPELPDDIDRALKVEKLKALELSNAKATEQAMERRGVYVRADHSEAASANLTTTLLQLFEARLVDLAGEIASRFELQQRDVLHTAKQGFRAMRAKIAADLQKRGQALPALVEDDPQ